MVDTYKLSLFLSKYNLKNLLIFNCALYQPLKWIILHKFIITSIKSWILERRRICIIWYFKHFYVLLLSFFTESFGTYQWRLQQKQYCPNLYQCLFLSHQINSSDITYRPILALWVCPDQRYSFSVVAPTLNSFFHGNNFFHSHIYNSTIASTFNYDHVTLYFLPIVSVHPLQLFPLYLPPVIHYPVSIVLINFEINFSLT